MKTMDKFEKRIEQIEKFASQCYEDGEKYSAFIAGAIWADRNPVNVWHDASEIPEEFPILCLDKFGDLLIYEEGWPECVEFNDISKWAYVKDLLPKQLDNCKQSKEV